MRKLILSILILSFVLSGCFHKPVVKVDDGNESGKVVNEQENNQGGNLVNNEDKKKENNETEIKKDDLFKQEETVNNTNNYDKIISEFLEEGYFDKITIPVIINCSENIKDEIESTELEMSFYGGRNVNGVNYDKKNNCIRFNKDCDEEILNKEEDKIKEVIEANRFNVVNGCLYDGQKKALKYSLLAYTHTDFFTKKIDRIGESADEWFRFQDKNNLYIYLKGAAGCGGCIFNGPYLVINLDSGFIEGEQSDLPYLPYLVLSPNKKIAIETARDENNNTKLYLFDFITDKRSKLIYEVPEDKSILVQGDGVYLVEDAITWKDNSTFKIQLYEKSNTDNYVKSEYSDDDGFQIFKSGEPIIIRIN